MVADFAEDPIAARGKRCGGGGGVVETTDDCGDGPGGESGENDEEATPRDDVGDRCFCDDDDDDRPFRAGRGRCTRWYPRLRAVVESLSSGGGVGVLINCAGVCYPHPEYFAGMSGRDGDDCGAGRTRRPEEFTAGFCDNADAAIRCNVTAAVHACRLVLPGMLARGRGLIVNVGSAAASMPPAAPLMTLYSATKVRHKKRTDDGTFSRSAVSPTPIPPVQRVTRVSAADHSFRERGFSAVFFSVGKFEFNDDDLKKINPILYYF